MDLQGKCTLFVSKREIEKDGDKKIVVDLSTTISSKDAEGHYINKKVDVRLVGKKFPEESLLKLEENKCYTMDVFSGFHSVRQWKDSHGKDRRELEFVITDGKLLSSKEVVKKEVVKNDDLPF